MMTHEYVIKILIKINLFTAFLTEKKQERSECE